MNAAAPSAFETTVAAEAPSFRKAFYGFTLSTTALSVLMVVLAM